MQVVLIAAIIAVGFVTIGAALGLVALQRRARLDIGNAHVRRAR